MLRSCCGLAVAALLVSASVAAQDGQVQIPGSPAELYGAWCAKCHAEDGSARVPVATVKSVPRDFTNCRLATGEPDSDWELVIAQGGPAAGMSSEMPAYGELLQPEQLRDLVAYVRAFCKEPGWPSGNLNLPRPLFTEKAFPEDEVVLTPVVSHSAGERAGFELRSLYEGRVGRRANVEISVPMESVAGGVDRSTGVGDIAVAGKYVLHTNRAATSIISAGFEVTLPSGKESVGLGGGTTVFEPFLVSGLVFGQTFLQGHLSWEFPARDPWVDREVVYNLYLGRSVDATPATWTFGVELNGVQKEVALTPQVRRGLTRTGALAAAAGVQIPIINRSEQPTRYVGYLLWEYLQPVRPRP